MAEQFNGCGRENESFTHKPLEDEWREIDFDLTTKPELALRINTEVDRRYSEYLTEYGDRPKDLLQYFKKQKDFFEFFNSRNPNYKGSSTTIEYELGYKFVVDSISSLDSDLSESEKEMIVGFLENSRPNYNRSTALIEKDTEAFLSSFRQQQDIETVIHKVLVLIRSIIAINPERYYSIFVNNEITNDFQERNRLMNEWKESLTDDLQIESKFYSDAIDNNTRWVERTFIDMLLKLKPDTDLRELEAKINLIVKDKLSEYYS